MGMFYLHYVDGKTYTQKNYSTCAKWHIDPEATTDYFVQFLTLNIIWVYFFFFSGLGQVSGAINFISSLVSWYSSWSLHVWWFSLIVYLAVFEPELGTCLIYFIIICSSHGINWWCHTSSWSQAILVFKVQIYFLN